MTLIPAERKEIHVEETSYKASISELTAQKIGASVNWVLANTSTQIGDIVPSALTQAQFQTLRGNNWVLMSGQSISGSDLAILTGITSLPNMVGNEAFLGQKNAQSMFAYEASQNKSHNHNVTGNSAISHQFLDYMNTGYTRDILYPGAAVFTSTSEGGAVARPNTVRVNFFIKINDNPT